MRICLKPWAYAAVLASWLLASAATAQPRLGVHMQWRDGQVRVAGVDAGGPAAQGGILPGDVIVDVDGVSPKGLADVVEAVTAVPAGRPSLILIERNGRKERLRVPVHAAAATPQVPAAKPAAGGSAALPAGRYNCLRPYYDAMAKAMRINTMGHLNIRANGTYDWMGSTPGRYRMEGDRVRWMGGIYGDGSAPSTFKRIDSQPAIEMEVSTPSGPLRQTCYLQR